MNLSLAYPEEKEKPMQCLICRSGRLKELKRDTDAREYLHCLECDLVFLHPRLRLSSEKEKERYLTHNNDIHDPGYKNFVSPLVDVVREHLPAPAKGLDFGSGSGPVLSHLLREVGYEVDQYDPYFSPRPQVFAEKYDFIVSCEVVEHLYDPLSEFERLRGLLRPGGLFAVMTLLRKAEDIFDWYYARDPTHVVFYSEKNLKYIQEHLKFSSCQIHGPRVVVFLD